MTRYHATVRWSLPQEILVVGRSHESNAPSQVRDFTTGEWVDLEPDTVPPAHLGLPLDRDEARAIYEALADHFGHGATSTAALRKDYEAERARVDRLITHAIKDQP